MGVDLHRVGGLAAADDDRRPPPVHGKLGPQPELLEVGLGFGPADVQQVAGVVEDETIRRKAAAGAPGLGLALEHEGGHAGALEPLGGHQAGQATTHDQRLLHHDSIGTIASHARSPITAAPTIPVMTRVATGSRKSTTRPMAPKTSATA